MLFTLWEGPMEIVHPPHRQLPCLSPRLFLLLRLYHKPFAYLLYHGNRKVLLPFVQLTPGNVRIKLILVLVIEFVGIFCLVLFVF